MKSITIYTKTTCPYCVMAKNLLKAKGISDFIEINIESSDTIRDEMINRSNRKTVPQIFIGDFHVGGFDDLSKLNASGELDRILG